MFGEEEVEERLRAIVADLDPALLHPNDAVTRLATFDRIERQAAAAKALLAPRAVDSGEWARKGERSAQDWLARQHGTSVGEARGLLDTGERLAKLPDTEAALRAGDLSIDQAREVSTAAEKAPAREKELLAAAKVEGLRGLKETCAAVRAAAEDDTSRYKRIHGERTVRPWTDPGGASRLDVSNTADRLAIVMAELNRRAEAIFTQARKQGRHEPRGAYLADALVEMAQDSANGVSGSRSRPQAMVHVRVDHSALVRGNTVAGETCEIPGVGPVPVATARALLGDCVLKLFIEDGRDVRSVLHLGRNIPAHLRTAVENRDETCVVPGCDIRDRLEIDHILGYAITKRTRLDEICRLCHFHHDLKSYDGFTIARTELGWDWRAPPD